MTESCSNRCESGLIHVIPKDNPHAGFYIFKCDCNLGSFRTENYPRWDQRMMFRWVSHKKYWNDIMISDTNLKENIKES